MSNYYDSWKVHDNYDDNGTDSGNNESKIGEVVEFINDHPEGSYIVAYADWCGHCHKLFEKMGLPLNKGNKAPNGKFPNVFFMEDKTIPKKLKEALGVEGFPTVIKFKKGIKQTDKPDYREELADYVNYYKQNAKPMAFYDDDSWRGGDMKVEDFTSDRISSSRPSPLSESPEMIIKKLGNMLQDSDEQIKHLLAKLILKDEEVKFLKSKLLDARIE